MRIIVLIIMASVLSLSACKEKAPQAEQKTELNLVSEAQNDALIAQLKKIDSALLSSDPVQMREALAPDGYKRAMGKAMGITDDQMDIFLNQMDATIDQTMEFSTFERHEIDLEKVEYLQGGDRPVARMPFEMDMTVYEQSFEVDGNYYAVVRDGKWLVLSPSDAATVSLLKSAFPELKDMDIAANSMEMVDGDDK